MSDDDAKSKIDEIANEHGYHFVCQALIEWLIERRNEQDLRVDCPPIDEAADQLGCKLRDIVSFGGEPLPREVGGE